MEERIEFDSVVTEKALNNFKMYHNLHNVGGVFGYIFAVFALVMCVLGIVFGMSTKYIVMMAIFGLFFLLYPYISMRMGSKKQMKTVAAFKAPMHYSVGEDKIIVSQNDMSEDLLWEQVYKVKFTGSNLILYLSAVRANVLTVDSMGEQAAEFVEMCEKKLKPFQVKVNKTKLRKAISR
ncbi:MAG: YcxB family protein [Clostridia bacterium]|nr:YcxB family protein [Clostridia bacterium]